MNSDGAPRLGFVGIGTMGRPMVHCLARAGFSPCLHDVDAATAERVAAGAGLTTASTLESIAKGAEIVILMLPHSGIVRQVVWGEATQAGGLAAHLGPGSIVVDMSSSDALETRRLGAELATRQIALLDAPVSGGVRKAVAGTLAILLGGDDDNAIVRATPTLEAMGAIHRTGMLGSGHAAKALNNYVSAAGLSAACEAVILGRQFGIEPRTLVDVLNASTGRNNSTENKLAQFVLSGAFCDAGFALDLMAKDIALAGSLADAEGMRMEGIAAMRALWAAARDSLGPGTDHTEIFRYLEAKAQNGDA